LPEPYSVHEDNHELFAGIVGTARFNDVIAIDIATKTEDRKKGLR